MKRTLPIKFPTAFEHEANLPKQESHDYSSHLPKDSEPGKMHKPAPANAHISEKTYWFPDSFNALRVELHDNWPNLWSKVGFFMAFDAITFIEQMDAALDTKTTFDSEKVDAICKKYLNLLRNKRGLSSIK